MDKRPKYPITDEEKVEYRCLVEDAVGVAMDSAVHQDNSVQYGWKNVLEHRNELRQAILDTVIMKTMFFRDHGGWSRVVRMTDDLCVVPSGQQSIMERVRAKLAAKKAVEKKKKK